jgi:hypothetical protein
MLGYQQGRSGDTGLAGLIRRHANASLQVPVDEWQPRSALGQAGPEPLLRLHIHAQDQPGTVLNVLNALGETLEEELPGLSGGDVGVWHALVYSTPIDASRLTVGLAVPARGRLGSGQIRGNRTDHQGAHHPLRVTRPRYLVDDDLGAPEDTVISVGLISAPAETP